MKGLLQKKSDRINSKWSQYYFSVAPSMKRLYYYRSQEAMDNATACKGSIKVTALFPQPVGERRPGKRQHRFDVQGTPYDDDGVLDRSKTVVYSLSAATREDKNRWVQAIREACSTVLEGRGGQESSFAQFGIGNLANLGGILSDDDDGGDAPNDMYAEPTARHDKFAPRDLLIDSLHYGDIVYLQWQVGSQPGYMHADGVCRTRLGVQPFGADPQAPDAKAPSNFQECLFRICPPLLYEASMELQNMRLECDADDGEDEAARQAVKSPPVQSQAKMPPEPLQAQEVATALTGVSGAGDQHLKSTATENDDLVVANAEAERENNMNLLVLKNLERSGGDRVLYGAPVQLQHVRSGKFVTVRRIQARKTPSAMRLELIDDGDHHSAFKLSPHFRNRVEGGYVYIGDEVKFESLRFPREFIHATESAFDKVEAKVGTATREELEKKKKSLITEVNLVSKMTGWSLLLYSRPAAPEYQGLLTNSPVRLFHADAQAFITASANHEKSSVPPFEAPGEQLGDRHLPYMRPLPDGDPYDVAAQSAKEVWCFELPDKCKSAALRWSHTHVRIKHLPTRKYLAVENCEIIGQEVEKHSCKLTHDMDESTLFTLVKDELIEGDVLPAQEISLLIMHELEPGRPVWLHKGKEHKEKLLFNSDGTQRGATQSNSFKMWFSADRKPQDTVKVLPCNAAEARGIETVRSMVKVTECFTERLKQSATDRGETALHQYAFDEVQLMLVSAINFVTEVDRNAGSSGATLSQQAADALLVEGLPRAKQQQQSCDLKLLDKLMHMQQAVVDACPPEQWEFAESYTLDLVAQRPHQLLVHRLCFHAIARILESNVKVQNYFGRQRILVPMRASKTSSDALRMGAMVGAMADGAADAGRKLLGAVGDAGNMIGHVKSVSLSDISDSLSNSVATVGDGVGKLGDGALKLGDGALKLGSGLVSASSKMIGQAGQAGARMMSGDLNFLASEEQAQLSERPRQPDTFIGAIIRQINASHDMGAANCLRKLVTDNMNLLETYVDTETIENFVDLIKKRGPRPEFLQFLATVCSCNGSAVASNQAACLQALWIEESQGGRETKLLLETRNFKEKSAELDDFSTTMRELNWKDAAGRAEIKRLKSVADAAQKGDPHSKEARAATDAGDFLGYDERVSGFPVMYVSWNGASEASGVDLPRTLSFEAGTTFWEDHFFVSGEELDHPSTDDWLPHFFVDEGTYWVPLSYLVWVLDPEAQLYESFVKDGCLPFRGGKEDFNQVLRAGDDKFKENGKYSDAMDYKPQENDADDEQHFSQCVWAAYARAYLRVDPETLQDLDDDEGDESGGGAAPQLQLGNNAEIWGRQQEEGAELNEQEDKALESRRHRESFRLQVQLAEYYVAQIELFAQMCLGRQYQTILKLEKMFSYSMLLSAMANDTLPFQVRAAFTRLLLRLYVDRYPQQKLQIPQMIHVLKDHEGKVAVKDYNMDKEVDEHNSELPEFRLGAANTDLLKDKRRHYNFPSPSKFRLIREFIVEFLKCDENKTMALHRENKNEFMLAVLEMLGSLVKFGFFNSISKIHDLADPLITQLDGRMDRKNNDVIFAKDGFPWQVPSADEDRKERSFKEWSAHRRYKRGTQSNPLAMKVKTQACKVLSEIGSLRDDFRLRLMVNLFRASLATIADHRQQHGAGGVDATSFAKEAQDALIFEEKVPEPGSYQNGPVQRLAEKYRGKNGEIHKLFASKAAQAFDLEKKTSKSLVTLLLDLMMYEDGDLFTQALVLFWRRNNQKAKLVEKLRDVVILESEDLGRSESQIELLPELRTRVAHMRKEVNEWQLWSQNNEDVGAVGFIGEENVAEHVKSGLRQLEMFCFKHEKSAQAHERPLDNRASVATKDALAADEDETKDDNVQSGPSISDLWHGLVPVAMHQRLLADLGAHDVFLKAISVPWQSIYDQEIKLADAVQKQEASARLKHATGPDKSQLSSTATSAQLAENAASTRTILLRLVAQGLSGLTAMLRGQPASAAAAPVDANERARWETERAQIKHTQRVLHEFLPQVQHVLKRMVEAYEDARERQTTTEGVATSAAAGDLTPVTLSTSPWVSAQELLEQDGIIMRCTAFITELFRRNDEIQTTAELFQQFAELINAAAKVSPSLASKYLPFYECVLVSETGEPLASNQARALPPLVDAGRYPNIIPNFIDVKALLSTKPDWRKFVEAIEYQAGLMTTFANCARGENNVGLTDLLQLLPEKGLGLNGLLAYIDALLTGLVPGIVPGEDSMHERIFTFDSPFQSWRTMHEQASPRRHSVLREGDERSGGVRADALTTTMRRVPGSAASARAARKLLQFARKGTDEERVEKLAALWQLLSAATDMLQQVYCDTSLVDFTFALHDTMWGDRQTPFNNQGAALIPKLAHAVAVLGLDWWPGARGHQLHSEQDTRFMAELEREACCGYMLRHGMPLLETFFRSIWPHGGSSATTFIWKEKVKLLRAVTTFAECVDLSDLECTTGAGREAGAVTSSERKQLQANFPPGKHDRTFKLVDSAHNVRKCAVKLIEALVSDGRTGRGVVSEDWILQTKKDVRSMRSTGGRSTRGLGRSRSRDDMERDILDHKMENVQAAWRNPAAYFATFVKIASTPGNWLSDEARDEFDAFVHLITCVEEWTSGEQHAGKPKPAAETHSFSHGLKAGMGNLISFGAAKKDELDKVILEAEEPLQWFKEEADKERLKGVQHAHGVGEAVGSVLHMERAPASDTFKSLMRRVTLEQLVRRVVEHITHGIRNPSMQASFEAECVLFDMLRRVVGRWKPDPTTGEPNHTTRDFAPEEQEVIYERNQNDLNDWGATELVVLALGAEGLGRISCGAKLFDHALELGCELLENGNEHVQATMLTQIAGGDARAENFFRHLKHRVRDYADKLDRLRQQEAQAGADDDDDEDGMLELGINAAHKALMDVFRFLQLCCEGHNHDMQTIVRVQPASTKKFDLLQEAITILCSDAKTKRALTRMQKPQMELLVKLMAFLTEAMQGPHAENQAAVAQSGVPDVIMRVMGTSFRLEQNDNENDNEHAGHALVAELRSQTMKLVAAMLEGRQGDRTVHDTLVQKLGASTIKHCLVTAHRRIECIDELLQEGYFSTVGKALDIVLRRDAHAQKRREDLNKERHARLNEAFDLFATASTLSAENPDLERALRPDVAGARAAGELDRERMYAATHKMMKARFSSCEVQWGGAVHQVFFIMPEEELAPLRMSQVRMTMDLGAARLAEFVDTATRLSREMDNLAEQDKSLFTMFFKRNYFVFKYALYAVVVLLNLVVLATIEAPDHASEEGQKLFENALRYSTSGANYLAYLLSFVVVAGYGCIVAYAILSYGPLVYDKMARRRHEAYMQELRSAQDHAKAAEDEARRAEERDAHKEELKRRVRSGRLAVWGGWIRDHTAHWGDWNAFKAFSVSLCAYVVFGLGLAMQRQPDLQFGEFPSRGLQKLEGYGWFGLVVMASWFLFALRRFWYARNKGVRATFCVAMDILAHHEVYWHAGMVALAVGTSMRFFFAPVILLDIVTFNETLSNVVNAAVRPYKQLLMTFVLFLIVILVYTSFGMFFFGDHFVSDDDSPDHTCPDLLRCFLAVASNGIRQPEEAGGVMGILFSHPDFIARVVYDVTFYIIVGALMFNMVTGIIVDTFGELREQSKERAEILRDMCFICGITRAQLEEPGPGGETFDFDTHMHEDHDMWRYVYFINYLTNKSDTEYNGVEAYVTSMIAAKDVSWFPVKRWIRLQELERRTGVDEDAQADEHQQELQLLREQVKQLAERNKSMEAAMQDNFTTVLDHLKSLNRMQSPVALARQSPRR